MHVENGIYALVSLFFSKAAIINGQLCIQERLLLQPKYRLNARGLLGAKLFSRILNVTCDTKLSITNL